ncbi:MAG: Acyl-CoA dehydrogenase C-terminal domain-containing protein [Calditrichia bacterium]
MANFYKDNKDIIFHLKHMDWTRIVELKEDHFKDKDLFDYAPEDVSDALDSYEKILEIVGQIAGDIIAPRAREVDEEGARFENGEVEYAKGTQEALKACRQADLIGFTIPRKYGGLNAPITLYTMAIEIISRADAAFMNIFGLQSDIADTIYKFADDEIKDAYLPRLCTDEITSSMVLTEPDAGSDLQSVMLKATQDEEGNWYLNGVKRFITNGNGQIALVLARSEPGTSDGRGLSMFLYERDEHMKIRRIEEKLGIHGSPTCELQFNNAPAKLIGRRKMGLIKYVMTLMNEARVGVSAQAVGIAEAAYREAKKYAEERIQFKRPIKELAPVAEMLANMRVGIEAGRALLYETTRIVDLRDCLEEHMEKYPDEAKEHRAEFKKLADQASMLTPMCKAFTTEMANKVTYDAIQVHGGTGYMKDFEVERHYRDARITNIYEGTTQLQIVAAIGGVMKGTIFTLLDEYESSFDLYSVDFHHNTIRKLVEKLKDAVEYVKQKEDQNYLNYHARRLVEMATTIVIGYLLARDAAKSDRKKDILKYFLEFAEPEFAMKYNIVTSNTVSLLEKRDSILAE